MSEREPKHDKEIDGGSPTIRLIFQYKDGSALYLDCYNLKKYLKTVSNLLNFDTSHGGNAQDIFDSFEWSKADSLKDIIDDTEATK